MIPHIVTTESVTFIAEGRPWMVASDHPHFEKLRELLLAGDSDARTIIGYADVRVAVERATEGRAELTEAGLTLDGEQLPAVWATKVLEAPDAVRVLLVQPGDRVRVEGDPDAPDGIYTVGETDRSDLDQSVYVESEEDFFGFVSNGSIKEILR